MAKGIKNRIFGSDVPTFLKRKIEARQRMFNKKQKKQQHNYRKKQKVS